MCVASERSANVNDNIIGRGSWSCGKAAALCPSKCRARIQTVAFSFQITPVFVFVIQLLGRRGSRWLQTPASDNAETFGVTVKNDKTLVETITSGNPQKQLQF